MTESSFTIGFNDFSGRGFLRPEETLIDPSLARVYLASALTGIPPDLVKECDALRFIIKDLLSDYDFLGVRFEVYDPGDHTPPGTTHTPEEVYTTDYRSTVGADLVIFLVNAPSIGVGMEAQISASATIPRVIIARKGSALSRMFSGAFSPTIAKIEFESILDLRSQFVALLPTIAAATIESAEKRRPILKAFMEQHLAHKILKQRIYRNVTISDLAKMTDTREFWLQRLEREPEFSANCTMMQLFRICEALQCAAAVEGKQIKIRTPADDELFPAQKESLTNLVQFVISRATPPPDDRVFRIWNEYLQQSIEQTTEAGRFRSTGAQSEQPVSVEQWQRRWDNLKLF